MIQVSARVGISYIMAHFKGNGTKEGQGRTNKLYNGLANVVVVLVQLHMSQMLKWDHFILTL